MGVVNATCNAEAQARVALKMAGGEAKKKDGEAHKERRF